MARWSLQVRPATMRDLPVLLALGAELRGAMGTCGDEQWVRGPRASAQATLEQRYREAIDDPDRHLVLVVGKGDLPLGMALLTVAPGSPLLDTPAVHMTHAVVADKHKRRGAGKALVAAAAVYAEQHGVDQLVVSVNPGSRDANRFFARLGFAPLAVRRVAPVGVVRRRLAASELRGLDSVVQRRPRRLPRLPAAAADAER